MTTHIHTTSNKKPPPFSGPGKQWDSYLEVLRARMRLSSHYVTIVLTQKRRRRFKKYMYYVNVIVSETRKSFALIWSLTYMVILRSRIGILTYMVHHISAKLL